MAGQFWAADIHAYTEREEPRFALRHRASLALGDGREISLQLRDLSVAGFAGRSIEEVEPGSHVTLVLPEAGRVPAEIVWQIGPTMGGRFLECLPLEQVKSLIADTTDPHEV